MIVLVRCKDKTVSVALATKLELLIGEGQITAYLGADGWVETKKKKTRAKDSTASAVKTRCTAFVCY